MPKILDYTLTKDELSIVRRAIANDKRPEIRHRATALHMLHQGMKPQAVADTLVVSLGSIYKWHGRWREGGLDALANQPKSGSPPKADEAYWQRVGEVVEQEPSALGYDFTVWTAERLIAHMAKETGVELSVTRFRVVMRERGYVYRRPKHDLKSLQDPEARASAEKRLDELKKGALKGEYHLLFVDETTLGLHPVIRACWMKKGMQLRIDTPGKQQWHHLFGAYNFVTDEVIAMPAAKKNSEAFVAFLDLVVQTLSDDKPIVIVMDNASYHCSGIAQAGLAVFEERVIPLFLPPYCSNLNPIERFWRHLKDLACANKLHPSMVELVATVLAHLERQNDLTNPNRFSICKELQPPTYLY